VTLQTLDYQIACVTTDAVRYVLLHAAADVIPAGPQFVFGGLSPELCNMMFDGGKTHAVGYYVVKNARVARDNIVLLGNTVLTSFSTNHPEYYCRAVLAKNVADRVESRISGVVVSLAGPGWQTWGHWLVDFLPRLYLFRRMGWELNAIRWLVPAAIPPYVYQFLSTLGVARDSLLLHEQGSSLLEVDELIVPQNLTAGNVMHPIYSDAVAWMNTVINRSGLIRQGQARRLFISRRSNPGWRELLNRVEIESLAVEYGYTIVEPSAMTVAEQIGVFAGATHIAGEYGSGLHNSIFAQPGAVVTGIRGNTPTAGILQNGIAQTLNQRVGYVIGATIPDHPQEAFAVKLSDARSGFQFAERVGL